MLRVKLTKAYLFYVFAKESHVQRFENFDYLTVKSSTPTTVTFDDRNVIVAEMGRTSMTHRTQT